MLYDYKLPFLFQKPNKVSSSCNGNDFLSCDLVVYACVIVFVSIELCGYIKREEVYTVLT